MGSALLVTKGHEGQAQQFDAHRLIRGELLGAGDGIPEVAIGASGDGSVRGWSGIYSISSPTTPIESFTSPDDDADYGSSIAFGTDLRGDGYGDLVMGAPMAFDENNNRVGCLRIQERLPEDLIPINTPVVYIDGQWLDIDNLKDLSLVSIY